MAHKRFFFGFIAAIGLSGLLGFAVYDDPIDQIVQQINRWGSERPIEKVYLHLDKPYYAAGDDIWFKAYVTAGLKHQLTTISGIVNVDLLDANGVVKQSVKLALKDGTAAGDFALPDTLRGGSYHIRAYTNYTRNAGSDYFFDRPLSIINNTLSSNNSADKTPVKSITVANFQAGKFGTQFFPESGNLVAGIPTKVAFKAIGADGLSEEAKGTITDNNGKQVAQFTSSHLGMGMFELTPVAGNTYTANIIYTSGVTQVVKLPAVSDQGYVLSVDNSNTQNLQIKISARNQSDNVLLIGQSNGKVYYSSKAKPGLTSISKSTLPAGIVQFTLFSAGGEPMNERLVFIQQPDKLRLSLAGNLQTSAPRQKVQFTVAADNGKPAAGSFSVAVIDESKVPFNDDDENNIMASLLLTSDLKGYVEQLAYYFNNFNNKTRADLDLLMLTQGYRRFDWKEIMNGSLPANTFDPEKALQVYGTVNTPGGKPVANAKIKLIDFDNIEYTMDAVTDARGRFAFTNLTFPDSVRFILQARTDKNKKDVVIKMDSIAPPIGSTYTVITRTADLSVYAGASKALYQAQMRFGVGNHVIPLREVIIRAKKQALKYSANLNGPGNADQVILGKDLQLGCIRISDCLQGRLVGVTFRNGIPYSTRSFNRPMQVILDGIYVDADFINSINYNDIQAIEVLRNGASTSIYGGRGGSGVMLITTKRGGDTETYDGPITGRGIKVTYPKGYLKERTFYSPDYNTPKENKQLADLRSTIYWNPSVNTGSDGKASFDYFNAGSKGSYRVIIEGVDNEGNIGRQVYRYKVE
ncbi:TonB-dependent receptor plug domain-containing protein [Mucilaginibacter glaciei]|uniref:TonB-dependent receptor plug domain-containing protein n=1 Tax=Mucilaginibacter glaciei TaxID=2772109 RepID=A0A926NQD3_9SPHI|nr:TonB-dependent receptor plug domain-containing protein [Mucilaginibacter glaciei]MBD1394036.1 TonB-dependent receptor plug domain-containing protein [Mucilaginibacter glaciei]